MNTEQHHLMDYIHILSNNLSVDEDVRENGDSEKQRIHINATTAELFAMMVTARALMEISETLKAISEDL